MFAEFSSPGLLQVVKSDLRLPIPPQSDPVMTVQLYASILDCAEKNTNKSARPTKTVLLNSKL